MYQILDLPYTYEKLEPFIDTHTLGLHFQKHQKGYLNQLNQLLKKNNHSYQYPMELLSYHIEEFPENDREDILFHLGGVLNHIIYFRSMSPQRVKPSLELKKKILHQFETFDNFKKLFKESALKVKGSGYTYLVIDKTGELKIINTLNQDCPYFHGQIPLLCIDVWEHAYYINYENRRDFYIDNFLETIDFKCANQMYQEFLNRVI